MRTCVSIFGASLQVAGGKCMEKSMKDRCLDSIQTNYWNICNGGQREERGSGFRITLRRYTKEASQQATHLENKRIEPNCEPV